MKKRRKTKAPREPLHDRQGHIIPKNPLKDEAMRRFIENVDEEAFTTALEEAADPKYQTFLRARLDPHYRGVSFNRLARNFGISLSEIDDLYRKSQIHVGMIRSANHIPHLMEDIAIDARSKLEYCTRCDGKGYVQEEQEGSEAPRRSRGAERGEERLCPMCKGAKEVRIPGDRTARDLVYESIGLIGKKGPLVAIQNNLTVDSELGELLSSSQKVLAGRSDDEDHTP
jgi:hypothetical protein